MKNKHEIRSHIPEKKFREIIYLFSEDLSATQISHLTKISKPSINKYLAAIRFRVFEYCQDQSPLKGEIEVDESYFGGKRKGKRGRGAAGKVPVFGLLKRGGKVYTKVIPDASSATLYPIIERKVVPDSIVYSDCWRGYNVLDVSAFKHFRINHSKLFADKANHINGIENF